MFLLILATRPVLTSHLPKRDKFLEDERSKVKESNGIIKVTEARPQQPIIKMSSQKHSRQGLNTAGPKINFQTSLSPDFLNLFAH